MHPYSHLHVFSLPVELLYTLTPRNLVNHTPPRPPTPEPAATTSSSGPRTCNICLATTFSDLDEQRAHFRSDWHRYNVKTRLSGGTAVTDTAFAELVDGLEYSISGSESASSEGDSGDSDTVNTLVNKTKRVERSPSPESSSRLAPQTAVAWFHSPPSTQIGIYKALFARPKDTPSFLPDLQDMQSTVGDGRTWAMFMVAGGHFAGAVARVSKPIDAEDDSGLNKKKHKKPKPDIEVLRHKTFHRYTTRRKQGGSQSLNDNSKGNAKSAGAQLRRYGEQALRDDIRNLLSEWADDINECDRIWIRASGANRKIFLDYEDAVISKGDSRLRTFPFPTRRPTQSELSRCLLELTRVKVSHLTEDALRAQDEAYLASLPKPRAVPIVSAPEMGKPKQPKLSKEEEVIREKWSRLLEMVNKGRLDPLKAFWERESQAIVSIDAQIPEWVGEKRATLLQVSAHAGNEDVTHWLLEVARADPTIVVPVSKPGDAEDESGHASDASDSPAALPTGSRRVAYDLAHTKGVRDVFRRCAAAHPDWWDWFGAGRVPSALSKQMEEERDEKKKIRRKGLKERVKEREAKEREKAKDQPPIPTVPEVHIRQDPSSTSLSRRLGGGAGAAEGIAGLSTEMRTKVERERRARAAEARLKVLGTQ